MREARMRLDDNAAVDFFDESAQTKRKVNLVFTEIEVHEKASNI